MRMNRIYSCFMSASDQFWTCSCRGIRGREYRETARDPNITSYVEALKECSNGSKSSCDKEVRRSCACAAARIFNNVKEEAVSTPIPLQALAGTRLSARPQG